MIGRPSDLSSRVLAAYRGAAIAGKRISGAEISERLGVTPSAVTWHLRRLKASGVLPDVCVRVRQCDQTSESLAARLEALRAFQANHGRRPTEAEFIKITEGA